MRILPKAALAAVAVLAATTVVILAGAQADPPTLDELGDPPEGRLAFTEGRNSRSILAYMDDGANVDYLPLDQHGLTGAVESDYRGGVLAWSARDLIDPDGHRQIFALVDGEAAQLTSGEGYKRMPRVSPDGEWIAYESRPSFYGESSIRLVRVNGADDYPLFETPVNDYSPSWSPDGEHLAFVRGYDPDDHNAYRVAVDDPDETLVQLTELDDVEAAAWSLDGERIAVVAPHPYVSETVWTAPSQLCPGGIEFGDFICTPTPILMEHGWAFDGHEPAWTPHGLAFSSKTDHDFRTQVFHLLEADSEIVAASPGIASEYHPAWYDDVGAVGYSTTVSPTRLWTSQPDGGEAVMHSDASIHSRDRGPAYSPDGRRLAYSIALDEGGSDFPGGIRIDDLTGPSAEPLVLRPEEDFGGYANPDFSPDGRYIAVEHRYPSSIASDDLFTIDGPVVHAEIVVLDLESGGQPVTRLPSVHGYREGPEQFDVYTSVDTAPSWSPDGDRLVFSRYWSQLDAVDSLDELGPPFEPDQMIELDNPQDARLHLWEAPFGGTGTVPITSRSTSVPFRIWDVTPDWSPVDPGAIAFSRHGVLSTVDPDDCTGPPSEPCTVKEIEVGDDELLTENVANPAWSPDGTRLAVGSGISWSEGGLPYEGFRVGWTYRYTSVWTMSAGGGDAARITEEGESGHWYNEPTWQPVADLSIHAEADPTSVPFEGESTVTITVSNLGRAASEATVDIGLPAGLSLVSAPADCTPTGDVCELDRMAPRSQRQLELVVAGAAVGTHQIGLEVTPVVLDLDPSDNTASASITVRPAPDDPPSGAPHLTVTATVAPTPGFVGGDDLVVTFTVSNNSASQAEAVSLTAQLPGQLVPVDTSSGCSSGAACDIGDIAAGGATTVEFTLPPVAAVDDTVSASVTAAQVGTATAEAPIVVLQPEIKVNPGLGPPGRTAQVSGENFPPGAVVTVLWDPGLNSQSGQVTIADDGTFTTSLLVYIKDQLGPREVVAESESGPFFGPVQTPFLVVPGGLGPPDFIGRR